MRRLALLALSAILSVFAFSQQTNSSDNKDFPLDSATVLKNTGELACSCIDSVHKTANKTSQIKDFANCIDAHVVSYQLAVKLLATVKSGKKENNIDLVVDKSSRAYKEAYYEIERWLKDNCQVMNSALSSNDDETSDKSFSENKEARDAYNAGLKPLKEEKYADAIPWFEKAVKIDSVFAFAWDNLAISYRKTNQLEKAEAAYKESLKLDPRGKTALQNLPVVYRLQNKSAEAIEAYKNFLNYYPDDPEVYYGMAFVYLYNLNETEKALDHMCKAYNLYVQAKSPYRSDAEKFINTVYAQMKKDGKEEAFFKVLKDNHITSN